jgi:hypothetical protein
LITSGRKNSKIGLSYCRELSADAVAALMTHRSKVCGSEWPEREIAEVVDRVMLPLLRL